MVERARTVSSYDESDESEEAQTARRWFVLAHEDWRYPSLYLMIVFVVLISLINPPCVLFTGRISGFPFHCIQPQLTPTARYSNVQEMKRNQQEWKLRSRPTTAASSLPSRPPVTNPTPNKDAAAAELFDSSLDTRVFVFNISLPLPGPTSLPTSADVVNRLPASRLLHAFPSQMSAATTIARQALRLQHCYHRIAPLLIRTQTVLLCLSGPSHTSPARRRF